MSAGWSDVDMILRGSLVALTGLAGCGTLTGIDEYRVGDAEDEEYARVSSILGGGACAECVARACDQEIRACAQSEACVAAAECMAGCSDPQRTDAPVCNIECDRQPFAGKADELLQCVAACDDQDGGTDSGINPCVSPCEDECSLGRRFACAGKYEVGTVNSPDELRQRYRVEAFNFTPPTDAFFEGLPVWMCAIDDVTCGTGSPERTDRTGTVTLTNRHFVGLGGMYRPLPFAVQVGEPGTWPAGRFLVTVPFAKGLADTIRIPLLLAPIPAPAEQAFVYGRALDCLPSPFWGARGVRVETNPPITVSYGVGGVQGRNAGDKTDVLGTWLASGFAGDQILLAGMVDVATAGLDESWLIREAQVALKAGYWNALVPAPRASDAP